MTATRSSGSRLFLAATVSAAAGFAMLALAGPVDRPPPQPAAAPTSPVAPAPTTRAPQTRAPQTPAPQTPAASLDPLAGPVPDEVLQALLDGGAPHTTVMDAARAIDVAGRVLVADLTGIGRDDFPGFWTAPSHTPWTDVRVQAATAAEGGTRDAAAVTLLWEGRSPAGEHVDRQRIVITLVRAGGDWSPDRVDYGREPD